MIDRVYNTATLKIQISATVLLQIKMEVYGKFGNRKNCLIKYYISGPNLTGWMIFLPYYKYGRKITK